MLGLLRLLLAFGHDAVIDLEVALNSGLHFCTGGNV